MRLPRTNLVILLAVALALSLAACRGGTSTSPPVHLVLDMDFQPKLKAQSETHFDGWTDGRSMRLPVAGTVAKGSLPDPRQPLLHKDAAGAFVKQNPLPLTQAVLERGRNRYDIHCSVCHGYSGKGGNGDTGHGMVGRRWPVAIPSFHFAEGKDATANRVPLLTDGEIYDVILNGKNTMPSYGARLSVADRWSIIYYVRALQNLGEVLTMTATMTAPPIEQVAPHIVTRVKGDDLKTAQNVLLGLGVVVLGVSCALGMSSHEHQRFYFSYLTAYMAVLGMCLCALFFTMIHHITRAAWSVGVRRIAENMLGALPVLLLLFVPILVGFDDLFGVWANAQKDPNLPGYDKVLAGKSAFLNQPFFLVRLGVYFAVWIGLATFFRRGSLRQDETGDPAISLRLSRVAAPGLLLFAVTISLAAIDWIMSLDPHWFSTIFGVCYFAGGFMSFLAFVILMAKGIGRSGYLREAVNVEHYHDLGKYMFAWVVFWTYVNFSQYILIWYANLPEETAFYNHRKEGGWSAVGTLLVFGHFFVPFGFLMSRHIKRNGVTLAIGAAFLLVIHWIDMQYLILPNAAHGAGHGSEAAPAGDHVAALTEGGNALFGHFTHNLGVWLHGMTVHDVLCYVGMLSLIAGVTLLQVRKHNLVPLRDPRLQESLHFLNH